MKYLKKTFMVVLVLAVMILASITAHAATVGKVNIKSIKQTGKSEVTVSWKKVSGAKGYVVECKKSGGKWMAWETELRNYSIDALKVNKVYQFRVRAYKTNKKGNRVYGKYSSIKKIKIRKQASLNWYYPRAINDGWYYIVSGNNNSLALDIAGWNMNNGGNLEIYKKDGTNNPTNQRFYMEYHSDGGYYTIRAQHSGKYIHIQNERSNQSNVHQWDGDNYANARWYLVDAGNGYYYMMNGGNSSYLDNSGGRAKNGNNVGTYPLNKSNAQKWKFIRTDGPLKDISTGWYMIGTKNDLNKVLDIAAWGRNDGANLEIYTKNGTNNPTNQTFYVEYNKTGGYYTIRAKHSGKYLHVQDGSRKVTNVHQWSGSAHNNAHWYLESAGSASGKQFYYLRNQTNGAYLDNSNGKAKNGNNVQTYTLNRSNAQKWYFYPVSGNNNYETYYVVASTGLILRKGPSTSYSKILTMPYGSEVKLSSNSGGWAKVSYNGNTGYCSAQYLSKTAPVRPDPTPTLSWRMPMDNWKCTWSSYTDNSWGNYNYSSSRGERQYHCGMDITGTDGKIYSAADGKVKYKGLSGGNGNHVIIEHNINGEIVYSLYAHMSSLASGYDVGMNISKGTYLGVQGNTGLGLPAGKGIHLHFGVFSGTYSSNPYGYVPNFNGYKTTYNGMTFYYPLYVVQNGKLP